MTTWRRTLSTLVVLAALTAGCDTQGDNEADSVATDDAPSAGTSSTSESATSTPEESEPPTLAVPLELREVRLSADERPGRAPESLRGLDCKHPDPGPSDRPLTACGVDGVGYLLAPAGIVGGVTSAKTSMLSGRSTWKVAISFDARTKADLERVTGEAATSERPLAFVLDGRVLAAAAISKALTDGVVTLDGTYTRAEAEQIATAITG